MFWFFGREACGILAPRREIEPAPPALEGEVLTIGPRERSLCCIYFFLFFFFLKSRWYTSWLFYFYFFLFKHYFIYLWRCWVFVSVRGPSPVAASGGHSSSRCAGPLTIAASPDAQAQQLWLTGPVAPRHAGSSQTRARTRVPRTGRQILNHCATREAPVYIS